MKNPTTPANPSQATALEQLFAAYAQFHSPEAVRRNAELSERAEAMEATGRWVSELPESLADALGAVDAWTSFPSFRLDTVYVPAAAVAHLGHGVWIHHTWWPAERGFSGCSEATLLVPCDCGKGYQQYEVTTPDDLIGTLADLSGAARLAGDIEGRPDCDDDGSCRSTSAS
ncbi:hypothetical protein HYE82_08780 [Streptomyces sp. BR123]|uniref:hypothetical protein n=1 Tax=Streptomyces sp. BR123 TaxID=2749828 RepID=UPI0015C42B1E|nr:hypothetical protein [Streptomyces sp. BR123]NXY94485.1 hypothetical protein [Streptomyces sp. BR123]